MPRIGPRRFARTAMALSALLGAGAALGLAAAGSHPAAAGSPVAAGGSGSHSAPAPSAARADWAEPPGAVRSDVFAAVTYAPRPGEVAVNRERLAALVRRAAAAGADHVVLPELALTGPLVESGEVLAEPVPGPSFDQFAALARELGVWIAFSLPERAAGGGYHVTTLLVDDHGRLVDRVRKRVLRPNGEDGPAVVGFARVLVDTVDDRGRRLGIVSGDDLQANLPRLADRGADTVLVTANWAPEDPVDWNATAARLARQYRLHVVAANTRAGAGGIFRREGDVPPSRALAGGAVRLAALAEQARWRVRPSLGLPSVPLPTHRPFTPALVELGRDLFFDPGLSSTGEISCASCHRPEQMFADGRPRGVGVEERTTGRNVPSLLNAGYRTPLQWDGNPTTLEQQFKYPLTGFAELNRRDYRDLLAYVRSQPTYVARFRSELGLAPEQITREDIAYVLGCFQRTLVSGDSRFDRYRYGGETGALSAAERRGLALFTGRAGCAECHTLGEDSALFMDSRFHRLGVDYLPEQGLYADPGVGVVSSNDYVGMFFTPSLRNVAETAPYMHDGSVATLDEAIRAHYRRPELDPTLEPLELSPTEIADLVAFLGALTGSERYGERGERLDGPPPAPATAAARGEAAAGSADTSAPETGRARARRLIGRPH